MKRLLVIVGPTGAGKTSLALELAKKFSGELISADSRQIYRGMDVGTGKEARSKSSKFKTIEKEKRRWVVNDIPIHLYDIIKPDERYSVAQFQQEALHLIDEVAKRGKLPILVGGTGLYVQAVVEGLRIPKAPPDEKLREKLEKKSTESLLSLLREIDRETFDKVDQKNRRRIIRALEVFETTGEPISKLKKKFKVDFDSLIIGLTSKRQNLYQATDERIESWFRTGAFQEEVKILLKKYDPNLTSFTSLGYQDAVNLVLGKVNQEEAIQRTKFKHHSYIRRQLTWLRSMRLVNWFDIASDYRQEVEALVKNWLADLPRVR